MTTPKDTEAARGAEAPESAKDQSAEISHADLEALYDIIAKLTEERDHAKDQMLRTMADMQNLRRRTQADMETFRRLATEALIRDLLPVLDNFERTLQAAKSGASVESLIEGVSSVDRQLRSVLEARSFERIPAEGQAFDPEIHEAVATEVNHDVEDGTVTQELAAGYRIGDVVIRPSKVKVAKKP